MRNLLFILSMASLLCGCLNPYGGEAPPAPEVTNVKVGKWVNIHRKNPDLVGVRVQQFPDCQHDAKRYEGRHPAMIIYVFKNARAHQLGYEPDGTISSGFWWDAPKDHWIWENLDRSAAEEEQNLYDQVEFPGNRE